MNAIISPLSGKAAEEAATVVQKETDPQVKALPADEKKLGVALVGLGTYSENQLAPALTETLYCRLTGVVSGDETKREQWKARYDLKSSNVYDYGNFDDIAGNRDIDIVYVVLPNALHAEYVVRAARAGKHVICEKPMATSVDDCRRMIEACKRAGVRLSMGYRLHFEPFNEEVMRLGQNRVFGSLNRVIARHGMEVGEKDQWRLNKKLAGGGPLMDLGIYCVQGALYTTGELPVSVKARFHEKTDGVKFNEVEEGISWEMDFPEGIKAVCDTSYSEPYNFLRGEAVSGWFELEPAFPYDALKGETSEGPMMLTSVNQQAAQMDDFALCIQNNTPTRVPGEMGLRDVSILTAIYESAVTGRAVRLDLQEFRQLLEI